jgi:hypothetical protein
MSDPSTSKSTPSVERGTADGRPHHSERGISSQTRRIVFDKGSTITVIRPQTEPAPPKSPVIAPSTSRPHLSHGLEKPEAAVERSSNRGRLGGSGRVVERTSHPGISRPQPKGVTVNPAPTPSDLDEEREMRSNLLRYGFPTGGREFDDLRDGRDLTIVDNDRLVVIPRLSSEEKESLYRGEISFREPKRPRAVPGPGSLEAGVLNAVSGSVTAIAALPLRIIINSTAEPLPELVKVLQKIENTFRIQLENETDENFARGVEQIVLFGMAALSIGNLIRGGIGAIIRSGARGTAIGAIEAEGVANVGKVTAAFDPIFDLSLTPTKEAMKALRARAIARMQAVKNGSFSPEFKSWSITEGSQANWMRVRIDRLTPVESRLVNEVLNAPKVMIGRSVNIEGLGYYTLDNNILIKGPKWTQRLQDVYNKALFIRTSSGLPVSVISGSGYTLGEVTAAEAGAALSGIRNVPAWPTVR